MALSSPPQSELLHVFHSLSLGALHNNHRKRTVSLLSSAHPKQNNHITSPNLDRDVVGRVKKRHSSSPTDINSRRTSSACSTQSMDDPAFPFGGRSQSHIQWAIKIWNALERNLAISTSASSRLRNAIPMDRDRGVITAKLSRTQSMPVLLNDEVSYRFMRVC